MTDFFKKSVTIYNDIPAGSVNPRTFDRHVIPKCKIETGIVQNADGTIEKVANAITVTTKSVEMYVSPAEYRLLPKDMRENVFTANVNDFVILDEVEDEPTTAREFQEMQQKYKENGFSVTATDTYINGMNVDNVQIMHV